MRQINLIINQDYEDYLHYISQSLKVRKVKIYSAVCNANGTAILSIAVGNNDFDLIKPKLVSLICDVVLFAFKESFLVQNIDLKNLSQVYKSTLLKALVLFDSDSDRQLIKKAIDLNGDIYLDSVFYFKLTELKHKWQEIVALTNHNQSRFLQNDTFLELIKFLIETVTPKVKLVNVYFNNNKFLYLDNNKRKIKGNFVFDGEDELALITTLIALAPNKINLHCSDIISDSTFKVLFYIFDEKVNLLI